MAVSITCATYSTTSGLCLTCISGYYLRYGACLQLNPLCTSYDANWNCLTCFSGYQVYGNTCVPNTYCLTWVGGVCTACQDRYYFGYNGICTLANPNCATFNPNNGYCITCVYGYTYASNTCYYNQYCITWATGTCTACQAGYYFGYNGICTLANPNCPTFNVLNGDCYTCIAGWQISGKTCIQNQFCATWNSSVCVGCQVGYYFGVGGICTIADVNCLSFNSITGYCYLCNPGWVSQGTTCIAESILNPHCFTWSECVACQPGYYFGVGGICTLADPICATFNPSNGYCTSCHAGYVVSGTTCLAQILVNPYCTSWVQSTCIACQSGYYLSSVNGSCLVANPLCATINPANGFCWTCITGYIVDGNVCVAESLVDPHCFSWNASACTACQIGYYFGPGGRCTAANTVCATYNEYNGNCLSCFSGYVVLGTTCVSYVSIDAQCQTWIGAVCQTCKTGYYIGSAGLCTSWAAVDPNCNFWGNTSCSICNSGCYIATNGLCTLANANCATFDPTNGYCLTCYSGWVVSGTTCVSYASLDANCKTWSGLVCQACNYGYYISASGQCASWIAIDPYCSVWGTTSCSVCGTGYYIGSAGYCTSWSTIDPYCSVWGTTSCSVCQNYYYIATPGRKCSSWKAIDPYCSTWGTTSCAVCNGGYTISNGICVQWSTIDCNCNTWGTTSCSICNYGFYIATSGGICTSWQAIDPNCNTWGTSSCSVCKSGYYLPAGGKCTAANTNCATYSLTDGSCLTCSSGWVLSGTNCITYASIDPNCQTFSGLTCSVCKSRYYLPTGGKCTQASASCLTFDSVSGNCLTCYSGSAVSGTTCVTLASIDANCNTWSGTTCTACKTGYYLSSVTGKCTAGNSNCATYNLANGYCLTCVSRYGISGNNCVLLSTLNPYCKTFNGAGACTNCSDGYYIGSNGICTVANSLCLTYSMTTGACLSCPLGYTLTSGNCITPITWCVTYSGTSCSSCSSPYYVNSAGTCSAASASCATYNMQGGACTSCYAGYRVNGNGCSATIAYCTTYSGASCTACQTGRSLISGYCY